MVFTLLLMFSFVFVMSADELGSQDDVEQIENIMNEVDNVYDTESGEINIDAINFGTSKADERIGKINEWMDENLAWLKFLFRMTPQLSWLFIFNLYLILWCIVYIFWRFPNYIKELFDIKNKWYPRLIGGLIALSMVLLNLILRIASALIILVDLINRMLGIAFVGGVIVFFALIFIPGFFKAMMKIFSAGKKAKQAGAGGKDMVKILTGAEESERIIKEQAEIAKARNEGFTPENKPQS